MTMQPMFVGAITVEDMKMEAEKLLQRGYTIEEIEERLSEMEDRNNRFSAAMFGISDMEKCFLSPNAQARS